MLVTTVGDMPRRWNSRLSADGHILLDLNAVQRNYREYPEIRTAEKPLPNKPWSCEVDYIDDPEEKLSYKKGYRCGKMHEVTVKVVLDEERTEDNGVSFVIEQVHYESPTDIQLEMGYSPWIQLLLNAKRPAEENQETPEGSRPNAKWHHKKKEYGLIVRSKEGRKFVWSMGTGLTFIPSEHAELTAHLSVGDFVLFKRSVRKAQKDIIASYLEKAKHFVSRAKEVERRRDFFEALVETRIRFPMASEILPGTRHFEHTDDFLGKLNIMIGPLRKMLKDKGLSIAEVYGKKIRAWAGPANAETAQVQLENPPFWVIEELFPSPLDFEEEYYQESEDSDDENMPQNVEEVARDLSKNLEIDTSEESN